MQRVAMVVVALLVTMITKGATAQPAPVYVGGDEPAAVPAPRPPPSPPLAPPPTPLVVRQRPEPPKNGFHVNPLAMTLGVFGLGYERVLHDRVSLQIVGQYTNMWFSDDDVWAVGAQLRPYFFFFRPAPGGMYLSPMASVAYSRAQVGGATGTGVGWSVGALIGYSWLIGRHVTIRAGGGVQYMSIKAEAEADSYGVGEDGMTATASAGFSGVLPALDFSVGFVF